MNGLKWKKEKTVSVVRNARVYRFPINDSADYLINYAANDETFDYDKVGNRVGQVETRVEGNLAEIQTHDNTITTII